MGLRRILFLAALAAALIPAAPAAAGGRHGDRGGERDSAALRGGDVPSRVALRLRRAARALGRAEERVDDGENTAAVSALASVRRNLAAALKSAKRRVGGDSGPDALWAVASGQHEAAETAAGLFDGADESLAEALALTLNGALDGRDEAIAAIAALGADNQGDYAYVLDAIGDDIGDELDAIDEALQDDALTTESQAALNAARTQLEASRAAVQQLGSTQDATSDTTGVADGRGECDREEAGSPA